MSPAESRDRRKPTKAELTAAANTTLRDVLETGLEVVFCGINPGLYTAAIGHHFGRPGNRFWKVLHLAGFTPTQLSPYDDETAPSFGFGLTNIVARATARADELTGDEIEAGGEMLVEKLEIYRPKIIAFAGMQAYRVAYRKPPVRPGDQHEMLARSRVWVLPNPSGLQAHYQLPELTALFAELRLAAHQGNSPP